MRWSSVSRHSSKSAHLLETCVGGLPAEWAASEFSFFFFFSMFLFGVLCYFCHGVRAMGRGKNGIKVWRQFGVAPQAESVVSARRGPRLDVSHSCVLPQL